ncbi:MAG: ABC transporter substrate binding protein [Candidatus Ozemobacteraceae bacterium]
MTPEKTDQKKKTVVCLLLLFLLFCWTSQAAAEVWVFYRPDIPLHLGTVQHLKSETNRSLVFCPVGKTSFSFLESHPPHFVIALGDAALELALTMSWKVQIFVALVDQPPSDSRILLLDTQQPYAKQLRLLKTLVPNLNTIWYPYAAERFAPGSALKRAADAAGMKIVSERLENPQILPEALRILTQQTSAALLPPDPGIMNDAIIQSIFLAAFRSRTPVIGFSEALVRQGAAFAYVLSPENLATAISEVIQEDEFGSAKGTKEEDESGAAKGTKDTIKVDGAGSDHSQSPIRIFNRWNLILNSTILEKFKLPISDQLKNSASKIF